MRSAKKSSHPKRITRSFVPRIAGELSQTKDCLITTTRTKTRRTEKGFVKQTSVTQFFLLTIKKIFAKDVKEKDT